MSVATRTEVDLERARAVAATVPDPELPVLSLADLGVLRSVEAEGGTVVVTVTPTYAGCPATATIRADLRLALARAGFADVEVRTSLAPAWSTDWITERGRRALREHGIAPPGPAQGPTSGPAAGRVVDLVLGTPPVTPVCPHCGAASTRELSRFGSAPCLSMHACLACAEPFEKVKEL